MNFNLSSLLKIVNNDANNWYTIANLKKNQKIEVDLGKRGKSDKVRISSQFMQGAARAVNKTFFNTLADRDSTVQWLETSRKQTKEDIIALVKRIYIEQNPDASILAKAIFSLNILRINLETIGMGYANLKENYGEELAKKIESEERLIRDDIEKVLNPAILAVADRLHFKNKSLDRSIEEEFVKVEKEGKEKEVEEEVEEKESNPSKYSHLFLDKTYESRWEARSREIMENEGSLLRDILINTPSINNPHQMIGQLVQGIKNDIEEKILSNQEGHSVVAPWQFAADAHRMDKLILHGETLLDNDDPSKRDTVSAYEQLHAVLAKYDPSDTKADLTYRVASLLVQSLFVDLTGKMLLMASTEEKTIIPSGLYQHYFVDVVDDKIRITAKLCFTLSDSTHEIPTEAVIVKREITIPITDLTEPNLMKSANPLPGLELKDSFSSPIDNLEFAKEITPLF